MTLTRLTSVGAIIILTSQIGLADIPRTRAGLPDLTGNYDIATLTPLARPKIFGNNLYLSRKQAEKIAARARDRRTEGDRRSDPNREAPPQGGDGSAGAAGNVGGYNAFWIDNGTNVIEVDGEFRTSIIYEPKDGRTPKLKTAAMKKAMARRSMYRQNTGNAWWLDRPGPGPYDDPELRPNGERCLLGFGSTAGPPMLPVLYNNVKRIVQTPDHVMILNEMVHDARIIRIDDKHLPSDIRKWMGDSIGRWEGDTLVVETTNFNDRPALSNATRDLKVVEKFTMADENTLSYHFTVSDPNVWESPWSGEMPWPKTDSQVYEYACHEGNYALGNILRGARLLEAESQQNTGQQ